MNHLFSNSKRIFSLQTGVRHSPERRRRRSRTSFGQTCSLETERDNSDAADATDADDHDDLGLVSGRKLLREPPCPGQQRKAPPASGLERDGTLDRRGGPEELVRLRLARRRRQKLGLPKLVVAVDPVDRGALRQRVGYRVPGF